LSDGDVVGHLDQASGDEWKGQAMPEAQGYQALLDELARHVHEGTLQRPVGGRDRVIVLEYAPVAGFTLAEAPCTTTKCAKQKATFRYFLSNSAPWRVKNARVFCSACGAFYRMVVRSPKAAVPSVNALRETPQD
jgi:hypothetical protein